MLLREARPALQDATANHTTYLLLFGIACSNIHELPRLVSMCAEFYARHGRKPTRADLIELSCGVPVEDVELFIRATWIRDSDLQPLLVSEPKTQFVLSGGSRPRCSHAGVLKSILYDLLHCRDVTVGRRTYDAEMSAAEADELLAFYTRNRDCVIGTGRRISDFWVPDLQIARE
jgi:hypothetical protein